MTIWLISDTHFGHAAMLTFRNADGCLVRPQFGSVEEMDEIMIQRWNNVVRPSDHVYHLGDIAMRREVLERISPRLHGHKRLVRGNHDIFKTNTYIKAGWREIHGMRVLGDPRVALTHAPIHPDSLGRFLGNVHGHLHDKADLPGPYLNVCVERLDYTPITLEEAQDRLRARA